MSLRFIDKYEIVSTLGRGSMGVVYKAQDPEIGRLVAIKTLKSVFMGDDAAGNEALQRFRQESRSAGKLHHPNIVTIFEAGRTDNGSPYIVMEYIEGRSIEASIAEKGAIEPLLALHLLAQIASAIDYAHSQNVIHRDIKPSNVIVDGQSRPFLLDFGVAKLSDTSLTPAGTVVGTPSYMSPEQIRGVTLDGRTDIFSFAVVAYEVFTGSRPFPGADFTSVVSNIIHKDPLTFSEVGSKLSAEVEKALSKGLEKDRESRASSALEFIDGVAQAFHVMVDGTGLVGGYSPGLTLEDVAAREVNSRSRAQTVVGAFQPSSYGVAGGVDTSGSATGSAASGGALAGSSVAGEDVTATQMAGAEFAATRTDLLASSSSSGAYANGAAGGADSKSQKTDRSSDLTSAGGVGAVRGSSGTSGGDGPVSSAGAEKRRRSDRPSSLRPVMAFLVAVAAVLGAVALRPDLLDKVLGLAGGGTGEERVPAVPPPTVQPTVPSSPAASPAAQPSPGNTALAAVAPVKPPAGWTESAVTALRDEELLWLLDPQGSDPVALRLATAEAGKRSRLELTRALVLVATRADFKLRIDALKALSRPAHVNTPQAMEVFLASLNDSEFLVRGFAVKILATLPGPVTRQALEAKMKEEKNPVVLKVLNDVLSGWRTAGSGSAASK